MKLLIINKRLRIALITILIILISLSIFTIYYKVSYPGFEEQKNQLYSYNNKSLIDYKVFLNPNNLYHGNNLDEGKLYITEFVNYIDANLNYELLGEVPADIQGEYNIIATVKGFTGEGEKQVNIWEKEFPIKQYQYFNTKDGKVLINENVKLNLSDYNTFVKDIKESSKINCDTVVILSMNVNLTGTTDKTSFNETISPSLTIPLDTPMFQIIESNLVDEPKTVSETIQVKLPVNKNIIITSSIILFLLLVAAIILVFFTQVAPEKDKHEKELKKIFKKYGERLVALGSELTVKESMALSSEIKVNEPVYVYTFDDLVRISDEISKPIFYKYNSNYKEIKSFFISNERERYIYNFEIEKSNDFNNENILKKKQAKSKVS